VSYQRTDNPYKVQHNNTEHSINVPTKIRELRKAAGLSQEELAKRAGVGLRFIRELEQGRRNPSLGKIAQVLALFGHHVDVVRDDENTA
jgi:y4mF family transcriptional regulator